jgi:hypothetical protein
MTSRFSWTTFRGIARGKMNPGKGPGGCGCLNEHKGNRKCAREATKSATMERRSAAERKSGIGGEMVRTKETNAADPDVQKATQGTAIEGMPLIEITAEEDLDRKFHDVVSALLENALLANVNCARPLADLLEKARQAGASEKEPPGISLADAWLAEPEWVGESSEAQAETAAGSREPEE